MRTTDFNKFYERAKSVDVANDGFFNMAGYFWIDLTPRQAGKMKSLLAEQGSLKNNKVTLKNGLEISFNV